MNEETFTRLLREFIHRDPFEPFVLELTDGQHVFIDSPSAVGFAGPAGGFITKDLDLIRFSCDEVRSISQAPAEAKS